MVALTYKSWNFTKIDITGLRGERGLGFHRLCVDLQFRMCEATESSPRLTILDVNADLRLRSATDLFATAKSLASQGPFSNYDQSIDHQCTMVAEIDGYRLKALEDVRRGQDFLLDLALHVHVVNRAPQRPQGDDVFVKVNENLSQNVTQSEWIRVLRETGYADRLLLEVPVIASPINSATKYLGSAQEAIFRGEYRQAVALCRQALGAAGDLESVNMKFSDADAVKKMLAEQWTLSNRFRIVQCALYQFTNPAAHGEDPANFTRADALYTLSLTAALLQRLATGELPR
jgi:hypothetical protein